MLAVSLFNRGRMLPPSLFDDLTKEYLLLPPGQNETLTKSVQLEKFLYKYKIDKLFVHIFLYVEQMARIAKHLRITERPVILAMGELTCFMNTVRTSGKDLGFQYPDQVPLVQIMGPRKVKDELYYKSLPDLAPDFPTLDDLLKDTAVSTKDRNIIAANLLGSEEKLNEQLHGLSNKLGLFMDTISAGVNRLDSFLGFHLDLFAHCDGEITDLMRSKVVILFNPSFRAAARGLGKPAEGTDGLLGGESAVRTRLLDATKEDELLNKTVQKHSTKLSSGNRGGGGGQRSRKGSS